MKKFILFCLIPLLLCSCAGQLHNTKSDYFDYSTGRLADGATARASLWNTILDEIDTGLALLPTEDQLKLGLTQYGTDSGAADAYVVTLPYTPTAYTDGMIVSFKASAANTGAATVNVDSLGVKTITRQSGATLEAADIVADKFTVLMYNSTSGKFEIISSISDVAIQAAIDTLATLSTGVGTIVSANDTTTGNIESKIVSADGSIAFVTNNDGGNETRDISAAAYVAANSINNVSEDTDPEAGGEFDFQAHSAGFTLQTATGDGTTTIDWKLGNKFKFTFGAFNETFTFTAPTKPGSFTLILIQDGVGNRSATWPTIKWANGVAIVLSTAAGATDIVTLFYDGTSWYAMGANGFATP